MWKRQLKYGLGAALIASLLMVGGCGGKSEDETSPASTAPATTAPAQPSGTGDGKKPKGGGTTSKVPDI